ncbi:hypothetical protein ACFYPK_28535 [Streptomyces halstedii]|uniref:hypothetical protein n=1 Tax=Streptomyces halstedii TaxID=1944 RepID=UPI003461544C
MTDKHETPDPSSLSEFLEAELDEAATRNAPLTPLDEAYIAHADALYSVVCQVIADFPLKPRTTHGVGSTLRDALELRRLADAVVESAVIVERERGASWTSIGQAADSTKQSAHERWSDAVHLWTLHGRRRRRMLGSLADARAMDEWYADLTTANVRHPAVPYAITAGLAATDPRNVVEQQAADKTRSTAQSLYRRLDELRQESTTAYTASFEAIGTDGHAAARQRWADVHIAMAEVCDELAAAEPTIAENHQRAAAKQRAIAHDIRNPKEN